MKIGLIMITTLYLLLGGCDKSAKNAGEPSLSSQAALAKKSKASVRVLIEIPALPVIENTISQLAPKLDAQFDLSVIQRICVMARGEVSKERIMASIRQDGLDPATIPAQGNPLSLLVNNDHKKRSQICAAWLASGAAHAPNMDEITVTQTTKSTKKRINNNAITKKTLSDNKITEVLAVKLSVMRANAEIYALIASVLEKKPGLSLAEYTHAVSTMFSALAPFYLRRVQELYSPYKGSYHLTHLNAGDFAFNADGGYVFTRKESDVILTYRGINWLGKGEIMGKDYKLYVNYFPAPMVKAILEAN